MRWVLIRKLLKQFFENLLPLKEISGREDDLRRAIQKGRQRGN
jgi:hypothetical protein